MGYPLNLSPSSSFQDEAAANQASENSGNSSAMLDAKLKAKQETEARNLALEVIQSKYSSMQNIKL